MQADSFTQIYQSYFDPVYRYALSLSGSPHIAEEITQETFFQGIAIPESISRQEQPEKLALCHRKESMAVRAAKEKRSADRRCHASFRSIRRSGGSDCAAG